LATGDPIARGNIELGVNTTPMEEGLSAAQGKAVEAGVKTENAVQDAREKVRQERAGRIAAEEAARTAATVQQATAPAAKATEGFGKQLSNLTSPLRLAVGAFTQIVGSFTSIIAIGGAVAGVFLAISKAITAKADAAKAAAKDLAALQKEIDKLRNTPITEAFDPDPEASAIRKRYSERLDAELGVIQAARIAAEKAGNDRRADELVAEYKAAEDRIMAEERLQLQALERRRTLNRNMAETEARLKADAELKARQEADAELNQQRQDDIDEIVNNWKQATGKIGEMMSDNQRQLLRQQDEQFARLRSDINGLFTTANTEVGINRVADLLETLIRKTEGNR
jgi:hypothetical protein